MLDNAKDKLDDFEYKYNIKYNDYNGYYVDLWEPVLISIYGFWSIGYYILET